MLYAQCVGLTKDAAYPLNPPLLKQHGHIQKKQKAMNETILPMKRKKSITISHTQHRTTPIPTPLSNKEKECGHEKKKETHTRSKKE